MTSRSSLIFRIAAAVGLATVGIAFAPPQASGGGFCEDLFRRERPLTEARFREASAKIEAARAQGIDLFKISATLDDTPEARLAYFDFLAKQIGMPPFKLSDVLRSGTRADLGALKRLAASAFAEKIWSGAAVTPDQIDRTFIGIFTITSGPPSVLRTLLRRQSLGSARDEMAIARAQKLLFQSEAEKFYSRLRKNRDPNAWQRFSRIYRISRPIRAFAATLALNRLLAALPIPMPAGIFAPPSGITVWWSREGKSLLAMQKLLEDGKYDEFRELAIATFHTQATVNLTLKTIQETAGWVAVGFLAYYGITLGPDLIREAYFQFFTDFDEIREEGNQIDPDQARDEALESWMKNYDAHSDHPFPPAIWKWKNERIHDKDAPCPSGETENCRLIEKKWEYLLSRPDDSFLL